MTLTARIRFSLAALALAGYFYLLLYIIGWMSAHHWPSWWFDVFPSRHVGAVMWLITLHTAAVLFAALPIGIAALIYHPEESRSVGAHRRFTCDRGGYSAFIGADHLAHSLGQPPRIFCNRPNQARSRRSVDRLGAARCVL